ncbi:M56/M15 family metallopeptidase [Pedobacter frigiditerrae]|uniref:M56/M15 family metallopeptidase n=1 Tax=Pedobacter frigiditerrae TaxID=2530452 RepID=UPI002931AC8E|nr:M56/M15 family metallopeptidase [Pedobacter frigiditerrae]
MEVMYYLLKVSACTVLFFAFYLLVLRRLTFFKINRFYLLFTLIISFIIPTLHFTVEREIVQAESIITPETVPITEVTNQAFEISVQKENVVALEEGFDYYSLLPYLYLSIVIGLLLVASWRLLQLVKHTRNSVEEINGLKIISKGKGFTNCSFFNYVFIDEGNLTETELSILLKHEEVHAKQLHSIDKIILMIIKAVLWFNPIVYLYDKALEEAHEYEADDATSQNFGTSEYAGLLLRLAISKSEMPLVHNFVKSPIKERIKMLFNSKSKNMKKLMYLLALPIGLGLLWGFTVDVVDVLPIAKTDDKTFTLVLDAGHGGKNLGATAGGFTEKDITLVMAKKIKVIAEAKGLKVVLTRSTDEYISINDRAKAEGTILLSLHVNSSPKATANGIEMITSGSYNNDLKLPKSNSITYYLYKELKNITGIKVNNKPKLSNILLLNQSPIPGILLEMGYLTNKSDFDFITNEKKQDELAKLIVTGILVYKESLPAAEEMRAKFQKSHEEFNVKYTTWKNSELYKRLTDESKNFKAQTLVGTVNAMNYVKFGGTPTLDGFILKSNNKLYRIYTGRNEVQSLSIKTGDEVSLYAPKAEVWFDSEYPAIKPKNLTVLKSVGVTPAKLESKPKLISSATMNVDTKNDITFIKKGVMEIGDAKLEAEDITWDTNNGIITAKSATLTSKNGDKLVSKSIIYDVNKGTYKAIAATGNSGLKSSPYVVNKSPEVENPTFSIAYQLLKGLKTNNDSLKKNIMLDKILLVSGKVSINVDGYALTGRVMQAEKGSNLITAHIATFTDKNGVKVSGDVIEFDLISKNYKITKPVGDAYMYLKN